MNNKDFCCKELFDFVSAGELGLIYVEKWMEFGINYLDGGSAYQRIKFCPFCGKTLPQSARERWFDELERQGIDPWGDVPEKYESSKWLDIPAR